MITVLTVLIVLAAIILVLVVLVQKSKGGGLSSNFASSNAIMGVHKTTDVVEKATWGLAGFIMVLSIACVMLRTGVNTNVPQSAVGAPVQAPINNTTAPDMNSALPQAPATATPPVEAPAEKN